jgi:hypothetical protein
MMHARDLTNPLFVATFYERAEPAIYPGINFLLGEFRAEDRVTIPRLDVCRGAGISEATEIRKEKAGILVPVKDGRKSLVTTDSYYIFLIERLIASHPALPKTPRPRTAAELAGLAKGNARRRAEAQERRRLKALEAQNTAEV